MPQPISAASEVFAKERILKKLRAERDAAAARGDHGGALILNDRINAVKNGTPYASAYKEEVYAIADIECPSCRARRDICRLCNGTGVVTEQQARDWPDAG